MLSLTVPAVFFLVMAVMFIPAVFFLAGIVYVIPKIFVPGHASESLWFIAILGIHFLVYGGAYYLISILAAKVIIMIKGGLLRFCTLVTLCCGLVFMTRFPVYGGGGHGPIRWLSLSQFLVDLNKSYEEGIVEIVYGTIFLILCGILLFKKLRRNRS